MGDSCKGHGYGLPRRRFRQVNPQQTCDKVQIVRRFDASPTMPQWWRRGLSSPVNKEVRKAARGAPV
jgi:hypothetical protein